jgi:hypothetical protein
LKSLRVECTMDKTAYFVNYFMYKVS